jgi:hypothetical protein
MRKNTKTITKGETIIHTEGGQIVSKTVHQAYKMDTEDSYVKVYFEGLAYIRDMPPDCFALLCKLMELCTYAEPTQADGTNDSFHINLMTSRKKRIAEEMGYKHIKSVSNLITELIDGGVLFRLDRSCYRLNPWLFGRGEWKNMIAIRELGDIQPPDPGATFATVQKATVEARRQVKAQLAKNEEARIKGMAGYTVNPETGEAIPLFNGDADILSHEGVPLLPMTEGDTDLAE